MMLKKMIEIIVGAAPDGQIIITEIVGMIRHFVLFIECINIMIWSLHFTQKLNNNIFRHIQKKIVNYLEL